MRKNYRRYRKAPYGRSPHRKTRVTFLQVAVPAALFGTFGALVFNIGTGGGPIARADNGDASAFTCSSPMVVDGDNRNPQGRCLRARKALEWCQISLAAAPS